jgi:hypothetical protein
MVEQDLGGLGVMAPPNGRPGEPEKLALPAAALERLVLLGLRTEPGAQWWDGFACAHGYPTWLAPGLWRLVVQDAALLPGKEE